MILLEGQSKILLLKQFWNKNGGTVRDALRDEILVFIYVCFLESDFYRVDKKFCKLSLKCSFHGIIYTNLFTNKYRKIIICTTWLGN